MLGLEEYYIGLLNEAKSPEEIKKILEYQFVQGKGVPQEVLDGIFNVDPTKKKSYTRWVLSQWPEYKDSIQKSIESGKLKRMFDTFKSRENSGLDLGRMKNFDEAIDMIPDIDPILEKEGDPNAPENDFEIAYTSEDGKWIVALPHTCEADIKLGKGCRWCTAGAFGMDRAEYYWNEYSSKGPLWINFDKSRKEIAPMDHKEYPYTRYQLCFEANGWRGELMDSDDKRVDLHALKMPQDVVEFYGSQNPRYQEMIETINPETLWREYERERRDVARNILSLDDEYYGLYLAPERNDRREIEGVPWHVYNSGDLNDPISNTEFDPDDCIELTNSDVDLAILRSDDGEYYAYFKPRFETYFREYQDVYFSTVRNAWGLCVVKLKEHVIILPSDEEGGEASHLNEKILGKLVEKDIVACFANDQVAEEMHKGGDNTIGTYVEIVWSDGSHTLLMKTMNNREVDIIIKRDYPAGENENQFTAQAIDGKVIVNGRILEYNILDPDSAIEMVDNLSDMCGKPVYIVSYNDTGRYNVYDASEKRMYFNMAMEEIETIRIGDDGKWYLRCTGAFNKKIFIANIDNGQILTSPYEYIVRASETSPLLIGIENSRDKANKKNYILRFSNGQCKTLGPYLGYISLDSETMIAVKLLDKTINILNTETGEFMFPEGRYMMMGSLHNNNQEDDGMVILQDREGTLSICNYENGQIIASGLDLIGDAGFAKRPVMDKAHAWKIKFTDGTYNLVKNHRLVLPQNVEQIVGPLSDMATDVLYVTKDGGKTWIIDLTRDGTIDLLPTPMGICSDDFYPMGTGHGRVTFKYTSANWPGETFSVGYLPGDTSQDALKIYANSEDGNESVEISNTNPAYREIYAKFFPVAAAVRENFNRTLKMITDFYKDK